MTDLEYMICEAESIGEIDLSTRNELLGALYESIALQRNQKRVDDEYRKKKSDFTNKELRPLGKKLADARDKASKPIAGKRKSKADRKKIREKQNQLNDKVKNLEDKMQQLDNHGNNIDKAYRSKSSNYHNGGANPDSSLNAARGVNRALKSNNSGQLDHYLKDEAKAKSKTRDQYYKDDRRSIDKRLDKYGTVESTDEVDVDDIRMEIYERELTGEITVEERKALLDYLDSKLIED